MVEGREGGEPIVGNLILLQVLGLEFKQLNVGEFVLQSLWVLLRMLDKVLLSNALDVPLGRAGGYDPVLPAAVGGA